MAYPDLEESNRVQREAYARNPVTSGPGRPVAAEPDPSVPALFRGESSATPPESGGSLSSNIDARTQQRLAERDAPAAAPAAAPVAGSAIVSEAARQPRVSTPTYGNEGRGNGQPNVIGDAVAGAVGIVRQGNQFSGTGTDPGQPAPYDREGTQAQLTALNRQSSLRDAAQFQGQQASLNDHLATTDRLQAGQDLVRAESEARVARFRAVNGADVVLAGPGRKAASAELSRQAAAADANVAGLKGKATAPITPTGTPLKDALDQREALSRGQLVDSTTQNGAVTAAVEKQKLEQAKQITSLGSSLANEKDPVKREQASRSLLTLLGKDRPEEYQVVHSAGGTRVGPDGFSQIKDPDNVVVFNKRTGKSEVIPLNGQGGPAKAAPPENHIQALKQDPAKYKAQFEAKYGAGSADQYLGK